MQRSFIHSLIRSVLILAVAFTGVASASAAANLLDPNFGNGGIVITDFSGYDDLALDIELQEDGKIVAVGTGFDGTDNDFALARYNSDGSPDTAFGVDGRVTTDMDGIYDHASAVSLQADGKIIAAGTRMDQENNSDFALARYNPDGSLDTSFDQDGKVTTAFGSGDDFGMDAAIQLDGKIIVVGSSYDPAFSGDDIALARYQSDGSLDQEFGSEGKAVLVFGCATRGNAIALQPDGKIVVAGDTCGENTRDFAVVRLNVDGSLDTTFGVGGMSSTDFGNSYDAGFAMALQPDGKIVLAGHSYVETIPIPNPNPNIVFALARYNSDGSLDASFGVDGRVTTDLGGWRDFGYALTLQPDGKILVAGEQWQQQGGTVDFVMARYHIDGSLDTSFGTAGSVTTDISSGDYGTSLALQPDGKILAAGFSDNGFNFDFTLIRYQAGTSALEVTLDVRPGKFPNRIELEKNLCKDNDNLPAAILTTPEFDAQNVDPATLQIGDPNLGGSAAPTESRARDIDRDGDKDWWMLFPLCDLVTNGAMDHDSTELVLSGSTAEGVSFTARDSVEIIKEGPRRNRPPVFVYPVDGQTLDYEGSYLFKVKPIAVAQGFLWGFLQDGVMVWENYRDEGNLSGNEYGIHPGTLAHSKFVPGPVEVWVRASINGQWTEAVVITIYLHATGNPLDPTFGDGGIVITDFNGLDNIVEDVAMQADGKILISGFTSNGNVTDFALARYNPDGSLDSMFGAGGKVITEMGDRDEFGLALILQADGRIIVAGTAHNGSDADIVIARYDTDGSLDPSFGVGGKVIHPDSSTSHYASDAILLSDGKIVVIGYSYDDFGNRDILLYRYEENGLPDTTFGNNGRVVLELGCPTSGYAAALQPDGKILVAGDYCGASLARFNKDGSLDNTFDGDGIAANGFGEWAYAMALQPDGRIVLTGPSYFGSAIIVLARFNPDGSLDTTFDGDGIATSDLGGGGEGGYALAVQSDGRIIVAGEKWSASGSDFLLARYNGDGSLDTSFGTDGQVTTDIRVSDYGVSLALQEDGKVILAGTGTNTHSHDFDIVVVRYATGASIMEAPLEDPFR